MPVYEYSCETCNHSFDQKHSIAEREKPIGEPCPQCGSMTVVKRIITVGFILDDMPKASSDWKNLMTNLKKKNSGFKTKSTINDNPGG